MLPSNSTSNSLSMLLADANSNLTMSSLEIANLTQKRHDNVKRTVDDLVESGVISLPQIEEVRFDAERRVEVVDAYMLDVRSTYIVVARLSPEFMAAIIDRWFELETESRALEIANHRTALLESLSKTPTALEYKKHEQKRIKRFFNKKAKSIFTARYIGWRDGLPEDITQGQVEASGLIFVAENFPELMGFEERDEALNGQTPKLLKGK